VGDVELVWRLRRAGNASGAVDEKLAVVEGAMHVCGEGCAHKLQSQFMGNVLENRARRSSG